MVVQCPQALQLAVGVARSYEATECKTRGSRQGKCTASSKRRLVRCQRVLQGKEGIVEPLEHTYPGRQDVAYTTTTLTLTQLYERSHTYLRRA